MIALTNALFPDPLAPSSKSDRSCTSALFETTTYMDITQPIIMIFTNDFVIAFMYCFLH